MAIAAIAPGSWPWSDRPNVGKSTLLNRLVGEKMAIVSPRPQTTRTRITGIRNCPDAQIVFVDTPGPARRAAGCWASSCARTAERALEDVDLVCCVADATERPGAPRRAICARTAQGRAGRPVYCCLNKADLVEPKARLLARSSRPIGAAYPFAEIVPVSAERGDAIATACST